MRTRYARNLLSILMLVSILVGMCVIPIAAASYQFYFPVFVTDNSSVGRQFVSVSLNMTGQLYIDSGKINNDALNTNYTASGVDADYMVTDERIHSIIPDLPSNAMISSKFYTGYAPEQDSFYIIPGTGGRVTVTDNDTLLEPSDNYTLSMIAAIDTTANGTNKVIFTKGDFTAIASANVSGNITVGTSQTLGSNVTSSNPPAAALSPFYAPFRQGGTFVSLLPMSVTSVNVSLVETGNQPAGTLFAEIFGVLGSGAPNPADSKSTGSIDATIPTAGPTFYNIPMTVAALSANTAYGVIFWTDTGDAGNKIEINTQVAGGTFPYMSTSSNNNGASYSLNVPGANLMEFEIRGPGGASISQMVSAGGVSPGEHDYTITSNSTSIALWVDGVFTDNNTSTVIPNTSDNWTFLSGISGAESIKLWIGTGNATDPNAIWFEPTTMIIGDNLTNRALIGNPGAFVWGANDDIIVSYGAMVSFESTSAAAAAADAGTENVPGVPIPKWWFASGNETSDLPMYDFISGVVDDVGYPDHDTGVQSIYFIVYFGVALGLFMLGLVWTRQPLFALMLFEVPLIFGMMASVIPSWLVVAIGIAGIAIIFVSGKISR